MNQLVLDLRDIANNSESSEDSETINKAADIIEHVGISENLIPIKKYPGYFWDTETQSLYSIKVSGVLKPLKKNDKFWCRMDRGYIHKPNYQISVNGVRKTLTTERIERLCRR